MAEQPQAEQPQQSQVAVPMFRVGNYLVVVGSYNYLDLRDEEAIVIHFFGGDKLELTPAESFELKQIMGMTRVEAAPAGAASTGLSSFLGR